MAETIAQVDEFMRLAAELGIEDTSSKTNISTGKKDFAGITPYNIVPKDFYKVTKQKVFTFEYPYVKASTPEQEASGKNLLTAFYDKELDREIVPTSIKGYAVEFNDRHSLSEFSDGKYTNYCSVIGQKVGDMVTNEPIIVPVKWMYSKGSTTGHRIPSDSFANQNAVGSNGMLCVDCIKQGCNQNLAKDGKPNWCKEKGVVVMYITHLGVFNKKSQSVVYTAVSDVFFASSWDLAAKNQTAIRMNFIPTYIDLSGSHIQGSFADPATNQEAIDGFGGFFEKVKKASAASNFFNLIQWKLEVNVFNKPGQSYSTLSFNSDGGYDTAELGLIVQHWKANKPEFVLQEVPFNKFTTELRGNYAPPSEEELKEQKEQTEAKLDISKF
jgi:hypothetical protein